MRKKATPKHWYGPGCWRRILNMLTKPSNGYLSWPTGIKIRMWKEILMLLAYCLSALWLMILSTTGWIHHKRKHCWKPSKIKVVKCMRTLITGWKIISPTIMCGRWHFASLQWQHSVYMAICPKPTHGWITVITSGWHVSPDWTKTVAGTMAILTLRSTPVH